MDVASSTGPGRPQTQWQDATDDEGVPWRMLCPVGHSIMHDPVVASDGNTYDRPALKRVLADAFEPRSPITQEALTHVFLPNAALQREIAAFVDRNPHVDTPLEPAQAQALQMALAQGVAPHIAKAALLASTVLPSNSADEQLAQLLHDVGFRPPRPPMPSHNMAMAQVLEVPGAPPRRSRRMGRLGGAEMARQPPVYAPTEGTADVQTPPQSTPMRRDNVLRRYALMPQTPTPVPISQRAALQTTRIWQSPPSGSFYTPTTRGVAIGSLAGDMSPTPRSDLTELAFFVFDTD